MRVVIQRVTEASVTINDVIKSEIGKGLLVLVGIEDRDRDEDIDWLSNKIVNMRIFNDENDVMNRSVIDENGEILVGVTPIIETAFLRLDYFRAIYFLYILKFLLYFLTA